MLKKRSYGSLGAIGALVVAVSVLGFYSTTGAAPPPAQLPFANSVDQRFEIAQELREIKELLKEQNALLREAQKSQRHAGKP